MAITASNIKLLSSQVMDDIEQGGGAPTATTIVDGASNSIFDDISELDRAGGRVNLRKVFASVQTAGTETYLGGNIIVADTPDDPNVSVTIFSSNDTFDRRSNAASRVESYLAAGPLWDGYLWENHIAGMRTVQLFQRVTSQLPGVGQTIVLIQNEGKVDEKLQYVRATDVSVEIRQFTEVTSTGFADYDAAVCAVTISDPLRFDFAGSPASRLFKAKDNTTFVRDTVVADAGTYCGAVPLAQPASVGDVTVKAQTIFTQLVPSAQTELSMTDLKPNGDIAIYVPAGSPYTFTTSAALDSTNSLSLSQNVYPGSLHIAIGGTTLTDTGGKLMAGATQVGTVDYEQGIIAITSPDYNYAGTKTITYTPAGAPTRSLNTASWAVTAESRSSTLVTIIDPPPTPGSLSVSYMSQGNWYTIRDNGSGQITGSDAAFGTGVVNYTTGSVSLTLGALPDIGSNVLATYGLPTTDTARAGAAVKIENKVTLANKGVAPGTVTVSWFVGATAKLAIDNGQGALTGDATGEVDYIDGVVTIYPNVLPTAGAEFEITYSWGDPITETFTAPERNPDGTITLPLTNPNVLPRTVRVVWNTVYNEANLTFEGTLTQELANSVSTVTAVRPWTPPPVLRDPIVTVVDNGAGTFSTRPECAANINYAAGTIQFLPNVGISIPEPKWGKQLVGTSEYTTTGQRIDVVAGTATIIETKHTLNTLAARFDGFTHQVIGAIMPTDLTALVTVTYRTSAAGTTNTETFTFTPTVDLTTGYRDPIVPGSVSFTLGGKRYFDRQGKLYTDINYSTGAATQAGTVNYSLGTCVLTSLTENAANSGTVGSMVTTQALLPVTEVKFRTTAAPIRPGGFVVQFVVTSDGTQSVRTLTANTDGTISAADVKGEIDYATGVVSLRFGQMVVAAGNEAQPWYDPMYIGTAGLIWKPASVLADSIRYAAVAYTYLPLDASILGIDPVRLPSDGRVPIFRPGSFAVLGHTDRTAPATVSNGQTIDCGRVRLSRVRVIDDNDQIITAGYTHDLDAGTVTFTDVTGYAQPITIEHRIEDMAMISDAQINGDIKFTRQITHNYPAGSVLSSALVTGDLRARVTVTFDQQTWDNAWADAVSGSNASASFNDAAAPIAVSNAGALTERWAIVFTSSTAFQVIGEHIGVITTGNTSTDCAPLNPATSAPYFTLPAVGWGIGWAAGNVLRFNTVGAFFPVWVVRTIQQGQESVIDDSFTLLIRGDIDRP